MLRGVRAWTAGALVAVGLGYAWWSSDGVGDALFGLFVLAPFLLAALAVALPGGGGLRVARLAAGGMAATCGALLALALGDLGGANDPYEAPAPVDLVTNQGLLVGLVVAAAGAWVADARLAHQAESDGAARERLATKRHAELLAHMKVQRTPARGRWLMLAAVAVMAQVARRWTLRDRSR